MITRLNIVCRKCTYVLLLDLGNAHLSYKEEFGGFSQKKNLVEKL